MLNPVWVAARSFVPGFNLVFRNFHVVDQNLTRSGQLTASQIEELIQEREIKSFISLRGQNTEAWFKEEVEVLERYAIKYAHLGIKSNHYPDPEEIDRILQVISTYPTPMHVQCKAGADRTGLFCSLYLLNKGLPMSEAIKQSGIYYGNWQPYQRRFLRSLAKTSPAPVLIN